jgi:hypothetical protein
MGDGSTGAPLGLLVLFAAYDAQGCENEETKLDEAALWSALKRASRPSRGLA